jgi:hypothetical protein
MSLADVCHDEVLFIVEALEARDRDLVNRYAAFGRNVICGSHATLLR